MRSSGGVVVKLLACRARVPGFDSRSGSDDFRDRLSDVNLQNILPTNQPINTYELHQAKRGLMVI